LMNGAVQIANMIELGQIRAGVVVGAELGRPLVENTIARLNADETVTRASVKRWVASLTIGSAAAAMVLCDASVSRTGNRLIAAAAHCGTAAHDLCQSEGLAEVMQTDSEALLEAGLAAGEATYRRFREATGWKEGPAKTFCHQVGAAHRRGMLARLGLSEENDFATYEWLGNTGSAALPSAVSLGVEAGRVEPGDRVGLLGIGSGVNCVMLGVEWRQTAVG
ncbi:MAG: 3-oxoacyl-[acyl-carrier-protein] synthase III C-terminal domain-containing protein, partial [Planctomycetota bacterium]